ncbi:hypothetical protein O9929_28260 [Vibrio lentus]|nr:hypothetical protein [Vibrio lentus]
MIQERWSSRFILTNAFTVIAPEKASKEEIKGAVLKRARWIWDNLVEFRANNKSLFQPASTLA